MEEGFLQKKDSHYVYGLIPKASKWISIFACVNATRTYMFLVSTFLETIVACAITYKKK
jgi:hypothetical protein